MIRIIANKKLYSINLSQDNNYPKKLISRILGLKDNSFWRS